MLAGLPGCPSMAAVAGLQVQVLSSLCWHRVSYCPFGQCKPPGQTLSRCRKELLKGVDTGRYKQIGGSSVCHSHLAVPLDALSDQAWGAQVWADTHVLPSFPSRSLVDSLPPAHPSKCWYSLSLCLWLLVMRVMLGH